MSAMQYNSGTLNVGVFTVCVDHDTVERIMQCAESTPWAVIRADYEGYMSEVKRPLFSQLLKSANAFVAVIDYDNDPEQALQATAYIQSIFFGKIAVVALSSSQDPDLLLRAMRAGCREFLGKPFDDDQFTETLSRLYQQWSNLGARSTHSGSVLSFFGAKGGVGSTTIAVHLAIYLVQNHQKKVLLIDNHPQLGHVCVYLGVDGSRYHFQELVRNVDRLDSELLRGYIATHSSGLEVLASPDVCGTMRDLDAIAVTKTIEFLRSEYDYVILDCATALDDNNLAVIEGSSHVYMIGTPEIGSIRDLSRYVDDLMQSARTTEKLQVVINRFSSRYAVSIEQVERAIRLPVAIKLPNSYMELVRSVNLGEPISPTKKSEFSTQLSNWAGSLVGVGVSNERETPAKSVFARWK